MPIYYNRGLIRKSRRHDRLTNIAYRAGERIMLKALVVLSNCLIFLLPIASIAQGGNDVLLEKPYFTVYLESTNVYGYIEFNRQLISFEKRGSTEVELPVNHLIKAGENELSAILVVDDRKNKKFNDKAYVKMALRVRQSGSEPDQNFILATLEFSGAKANAGNGIEGKSQKGRLNSRKGFEADSNGDVIVYDVCVEDFQNIGNRISRKVKLPAIGLPRWAFFDSDDITKIKDADLNGILDDSQHEQLIREMLPIYTTIWNALQSKDISSILPLFEERNREYDAAYYRQPGTTARMLAKDLRKSATDPERKLFPITADNIESQVYDNDKLARLMQNSHKGLIALNFVGGGSEYYDIILRKENGRWIITR